MAYLETESGLFWVWNKSLLSALSLHERDLDLELIFPIRDEPSASFMSLKAECLCRADVIGELERQWVQSRARTVVDSKQAA